MAQFNQLLGQTEKTSLEELTQFYPTINENQTVQYIVNSINPDDQHLQGQQILVSTDQLMLIENQGQVILDPTQVTYQPTSQYIVHDGTATIVDNRPQQQIYYMKEEINNTKQIQQQNTPIVLNHLQPNRLKTHIVNTVQKVATLQNQQMPPPPVRQIQNQSRMPVQHHQLPQANNANSHRLGIQTQQSKQMVQNQAPRPLAPNLLQDDQDSEDSVTLPNGSVVSVEEYKQLIANGKSVLEIQENSEATFLEPASPKKRPNRNNTGRGRANLTPRVPRVTGRAPIHKNVQQQQVEYKVQNNIHGTVDAATSTGPQLPSQMQNQFANQQQNVRNLNHSMPNQQQFLKTMNQPRQNQQQQVLAKNLQQQQPAKNMGGLQQQNQQPNAKNVAPHMHPQLSKINRQPQQQFNRQQQASPNAQQQPQLKTNVPQQQQQQQQQQQTQSQSNYVQPQYIIQPPSQRQSQNVCPLPSYVPSLQIQQIIENTPVSEEYNDSIRMLVLLENGEQRLITFTLPKEVCTIQEILEQVGVPFQKDTRIELIETNSNGINYFVMVGNFPKLQNQEQRQEQLMETEECTSQPLPQPSSQQPQQEQKQNVELSRSPSPEPIRDVPKFVPGKCAVCNHCGYLSENFNKCLRCNRKLPEDVKAVAATTANDKKQILQSNNQQQNPMAKKENEVLRTNSPGGITINTKNPAIAAKKKPKSKIVEQEPVILTLSSDDEDDNKPTKGSPPISDHLLRRLSESAVSLSTIKKEPSASDIEKNSHEKQTTKGANMGDIPDITTEITCRSMRLGSYRFVPKDNLVIKTSGISFKVPTLKDNTDIKTINIDKDGIVKILASFQKAMPVLFYYCSPTVAKTIRDELGMTKEGEHYFDPLSDEEAFKRITVLINTVPDETRNNLRKIYSIPFNIMDELTTAEANELLCKTCPKEISSVIASVGYLEIKQLLIYPPGKGGLPINTEDYLCLGQDQFLNDVIIDFYLKYLVLNLPQEQQEKVYVFSTFFYKRLTTKPMKGTRKSHPLEHDPSLTPAQRRHARVEKWTKSVNLFNKDFIVIPINENCHWFLAIVCFPGLTGCFTFDGKSVKLEPKTKKTVKAKKEEKPIPCEELDASDKDEAEGDESELESEEEGDSEEIINEKDTGQPIKQPCILIFDSLAGTGRSRVVATLRDYLTCEHKAKLGVEKIFTKDVIKGACPKVPQQTNFTDCGLYLLQYVEQFFVDPIKDYRMPIKQLKNWFDKIIVTKKREDIANLIKELMVKYDRDPSVLPEITVPTRNGKLLSPEHMMDDCDEEDYDEEEEEEEEEEEDEEDDEDEEDMGGVDLEGFRQQLASRVVHVGKIPHDSSGSVPKQKEIKYGPCFSDEEQSAPVPSKESSVRSRDGFKQENVLLKPDLCEVSTKPSNRDALSYLKAKRIIRHKNIQHIDPKKFKSS